MNKVILSGKILGKPLISKGKNARLVAKYWLAVRRENSLEEDLFRVFAFNENADYVVEYLHENSFIMIEGSLRSYKGPKNSMIFVVVRKQELTKFDKEIGCFRKSNNELLRY